MKAERLLRFCVQLLVLFLATGDIVRQRKKLKTPRSNEYKIKRLILRHYDKTTRPVHDDRTPCQVNVAISLYHILDTNEKEQTFTSLLAIRQRWVDEYLVWNASKFGGVDTIRIPADRLWTPDLVISNFAGDKFNDYMVTNAIVTSDGGVLWLYPALIKTYCTLNVKYFPFDSQNCHIEFISWTHSGEQLDILYNSSFKNSVYYTPENQEWVVDSISAERHVKYYACCKEPYPDVRFTIHMRRGSLFYIVNLIAPCFLIFLISFLGFFLPVESGEKVNLETTILLALVVFLLMVGETMPPTPDAIPILGMFFGSTMVMVTIALVMAVIVTNIYAKKDSPTPAPRLIVKIATKFYPTQYLPERCQERRKGECNGRGGEVGSGGLGMCGCWRRRRGREHLAMDSHRVEYRDPQGYPVIVSAVPGAQDPETESLTSACCGCTRHSHGPRYSFSNYDFERYEAEWKLVAKLADRIFFWVFVALSIGTQTALFMQMVPTKDQNAPPPTDDPGLFFECTMVMVTIALVMAVVVTNIYAKKDLQTRAPGWVVRLAERVYPGEPLPPEEGEGEGEERGETVVYARPARDGEFRQYQTHPYPASLPRGKPPSPRGKPASPRGKTPRDPGCLTSCTRPRRSVRQERHEAEWKLVAMMADRVFFWIFLILTTAVQTALFLNMVPPEPEKPNTDLDNV